MCFLFEDLKKNGVIRALKRIKTKSISILKTRAFIVGDQNGMNRHIFHQALVEQRIFAISVLYKSKIHPTFLCSRFNGSHLADEKIQFFKKKVGKMHSLKYTLLYSTSSVYIVITVVQTQLGKIYSVTFFWCGKSKTIISASKNLWCFLRLGFSSWRNDEGEKKTPNTESIVEHKLRFFFQCGFQAFDYYKRVECVLFFTKQRMISL